MEFLVGALSFDRIARLVDRIPTAVLTLLLAYVTIRGLQVALGFALKTTHVAKPMQAIIVQAFSALVWMGGVALVLQSLGLNQIAIALSGSVAIIGLGMASGANKLVADIVAGLYLAKNRDFTIGQRVRIGEMVGRIHSLDARKVRLLGDDGTLFIIPNAKFDEDLWRVVPVESKEKQR